MLTKEKLKKIISNPFTEHPVITFLNFFNKNKITVINKIETHTPEYSKLLFTIKKNKLEVHINIHINDYYLINLQISSSNRIESIVSKDIYEVIYYVNNFINGESDAFSKKS